MRYYLCYCYLFNSNHNFLSFFIITPNFFNQMKRKIFYLTPSPINKIQNRNGVLTNVNKIQLNQKFVQKRNKK